MPSQFEYYQQVILSPSNKETLVDIIIDEQVEEYFQSIEIKLDGHLYFEGYDGMESGTISKDINLYEDFIRDYVDVGMCTVSSGW